MVAAAYVGTEGKDIANGAYDLMYGDNGDDILTSNYNVLNVDVIIFGGAGNDNLNYFDGYQSRAIIFGDTGNDVIDGGDNADRLYGGSGSDVLTGAKGGDTIHGGTGNDRLYGYWTTADNTSDGHDYLYGDGGNDKLSGQWGDDDLHGGTGNDILIGGQGKDEFWFDTKLNATTNVDHIKDFEAGTDKISLSKAIFKAVGASQPINGSEFFVGRHAHDSDDHIIYQQSTGKLFYDRDGTGPAQQVLFAVLDNKAAISAFDVWCILSV